MDRGAWQATVSGVTKSRTRLKQLSMQGSAGELSIYIAANPLAKETVVKYSKVSTPAEPYVCVYTHIHIYMGFLVA